MLFIKTYLPNSWKDIPKKYKQGVTISKINVSLSAELWVIVREIEMNCFNTFFHAMHFFFFQLKANNLHIYRKMHSWLQYEHRTSAQFEWKTS